MSKITKHVLLKLPKNVGAIQISNNLTLVERKLMNIILCNAVVFEKSELMHQNGGFVKDKKKFYTISFKKIEETLEWKEYASRPELKEAFKKLVETSLQFNILKKHNTDGGKWNIITSLLSEVIIDTEENEIHYAFSNSIKDIIVKPTLYAWINLHEQNKIDSRYTLALWEYLQGSISVCSETNTKTEYISVENYTELVAGTQSNYLSFKDINRFLIKKPLEELNNKTALSAEVGFKKEGRKVIGVSFDIQQKNSVKQQALDFSDSNNTVQKITDNSPSDKANELMIKYNISEKKRKEFIKKFSEKHISENIEYLLQTEEYKTKKPPVGLIIKAIEDNYTNFGPEKDLLEKRKKLIFELRQILNNFDRTSSKFLRNIVNDYIIYKERADKDNLAKAIEHLKRTFTNIETIKQELISLGYENEENILKEIGINSPEKFKEILQHSQDEIHKIQQNLHR